MATIICPNCRELYDVNDDVVGSKVECGVCHANFTATSSSISLKPIASSSGMVTTSSRIGKKWMMLFATSCTIIIIQFIVLIVLISQRGTGGANTSHVSSTGQAAVSLPPGTPSELLLKYAEQGELSYVEAVLKQNPALDVNRPRTADNKTALYIACEKGYADIAKFLLGKKADASICDTGKVTIRSGMQYSPLTIAAKNGHLAVVKVLLSSGVDIEARDDGDRTALYAAAAENKPDVVRFLCESNAKVNIVARHGSWTPLKAAVHIGYTEVVKVLLKYGKGIDLEMRIRNNTVLFDAVEGNKPDIVRLLCESNAKVNICGDADTPLTYAAKEGFIGVIKALLQYGKGIDLEMRCKCWFSAPPLYHAAIRGHTEAVAILCEAGADLNARDGKFGNTPREAASIQGHKDTVKILEKYEAVRQKRAQSHLTEQGNVRTQKANEETHSSNQQCEVEKLMKEFSGRIDRINDDCTVVIRDFTKSGIYFGIQRKVRFDGIKIKSSDSAKEFLRRRGFGEVRVTYKELDSDGFVRGTIWDGACNGRKSLNTILVEEHYADYDK